MSPEIVRQDVDACPNMRRDATSVGLRSRFLEFLQAAGRSLKQNETCTKSDEIDDNGEALGIATRTCTGLESISLTGTADQLTRTIAELYCVSRPCLTKFHLQFKKKGDVVPALRELGNRAAVLHDFAYDGVLPEIGAFDVIARGAPLLEFVRIDLFYNMQRIPDFEARVVDIVQTFATCPGLRLLEIWEVTGFTSRLDAVADICARLRLGKGCTASVTVLGTDYL